MLYINSGDEFNKRNETGCTLYDVITLDSDRVLHEFKDGAELDAKIRPSAWSILITTTTTTIFICTLALYDYYKMTKLDLSILSESLLALNQV